MTRSPASPASKRLDMLGEVGAGVDDRDLALADDIGAGASKGERARVARHDAPDARRDRLEPAVFEREIAAERDLDSHLGEITSIMSSPRRRGR